MVEKKELKREISFKVPVDMYAKYKRYCDSQGVMPAVDLRRYITERATSSYVFGERVTFFALNMHMKNIERYSVPYDGDEDQRIDEIADYIIASHSDVACLSEFMPTEKGKRLVERLENAGYTIHYPVSDMDYERAKNLWCVTILAIKNDRGLKFEQIYDTNEMFPQYRYVAGVLSKGSSSIVIVGVHVPCVDDDTNPYQVDRKEKSLAYLKELKDLYSSKQVLFFGDFNETFEGKDIFDDMIDVTGKKATWDKYGIDKFLVTQELSSHCKGSAVIDHPVIQNLTDHCAIRMNLD
ncbi:MAG: endonuclease/exonuclease/phosphatase family protein [Lachnospiraceae bacterium]|nr:endonuclease/exonuclease/phosphatase family protein [Lachnospiraceae bacterium]